MPSHAAALRVPIEVRCSLASKLLLAGAHDATMLKWSWEAEGPPKASQACAAKTRTPGQDARSSQEADKGNPCEDPSGVLAVLRCAHRPRVVPPKEPPKEWECRSA